MVFSSNVFLLYFMPVFFLVYFLLPRKILDMVQGDRITVSAREA